MNKFLATLVITLLLWANAFAHGGSHSVGDSIFNKDYKYRINNGETHYGHFYVRNSRVKRNGNEKLRIEHTLHIAEEDFTKIFNVKYDEANSLLSYSYELDSQIYYLNFFIDTIDLETVNNGALVIFNKTDNSFTLVNVTLEAAEDTLHDESDTHHE